MSPLAHAANIHIDLAAPNFGVQEWSGIEPPNFVIQDLKGPHGALLEVFQGLPEFRRGYVYANDKPGLGAVSYTHLDVYKRQGYYFVYYI